MAAICEKSYRLVEFTNIIMILMQNNKIVNNKSVQSNVLFSPLFDFTRGDKIDFLA